MAESYEELEKKYEKIKADSEIWRNLAKDLYEYYHLGIGSSQCVNKYIDHAGTVYQ